MCNLQTGATQRPSKKHIGESHLYLQGKFLSVLDGVDTTFPKFMWYNLLVQTELTLNPIISAWEPFNGAFDYTATPLGLIGCKIIIQATSKKRKSWDQIRHEGFSVGPELHHYRCIQAIDSKTKSLRITDTAEYLHAYLTQHHVMVEDRMTNTIHLFLAALKEVPNSICDSQLTAIEAVRTIFENWRTVESLPPASPKVVPPSKPIVTIKDSSPIRYPAPTSKGDQGRDRVTTSKCESQQQPIVITKKTQVAANSKGDQEPIATRTRSRITSANLPPFKAIQPLSEPVPARKRSNTMSHNYTNTSHSQGLAAQLMTHVASSFLDHDIVKQLNYGQLRNHPKFQEICNKYFSNEMGRLC